MALPFRVDNPINAEVDKLIKANFIREVQYLILLANIIPIRKKNDKLRICVDFRDLNNACLRMIFHYLSPNSLWMPLPSLVHCVYGWCFRVQSNQDES